MFSRLIRAAGVLLLALLFVPVIANAQYNSPNYSIEEVMIGTGGDPELCGDEYCAQQSTGSTGGNASSENYQLLGGFGTPGDPSLSVIVTGGLVDLGVLNTSSPSVASTEFSVSNYLSHGYVVRIHGNTPTNTSGPSTHSLTPLNSPTGSVPGEEQFGINLVANSNPGVGSDPVQFPDSSFSYGQPSVGYDQANYFKYENGGVVAESIQESGQTNYTMSIIANIANSTPGGRYQTTLVVQAIATF